MVVDDIPCDEIGGVALREKRIPTASKRGAEMAAHDGCLMCGVLRRRAVKADIDCYEIEDADFDEDWHRGMAVSAMARSEDWDECVPMMQL